MFHGLKLFIGKDLKSHVDEIRYGFKDVHEDIVLEI